jgi:hypothetical protein
MLNLKCVEVGLAIIGLIWSGAQARGQSPISGPAVTLPAQFAISPPMSDAPEHFLNEPAVERDAREDLSGNLIPGVHFDGLSANGASDGLSDANIAVGLWHIVQVVNSEYAVYDKAGGILSGYPKPLSSIWEALGAPCNTNGADPIVQYDKAAHRWFLSQGLKTSPHRECIAVSTTSDPAGSYALYSYDFGDIGNDWPKFGVWPTATNSAYLGSYNLFQIQGPLQRFVGAALCAYDREEMLDGHPDAKQICFALNNNEQSYLPSDLDGSIRPPAGSPGYFLSLGINNDARVNLFQTLTLFKLAPDFANPAASSLTGPTLISVEPFSVACNGGGCIPQSGTTNLLGAIGDRLMYRLAYRNFGDHESLVTDHAITAGSSVGIRWYELRDPNGDVNVFQQGTFAPDLDYRWMGSMAMDRAGDIGLGYNVSSGSTHPGISCTGRDPGDPLGAMEAEVALSAGAGSQLHIGKWSDTSSMRIDPADDCTFWYTTEYLKADGDLNWTTHIASFSFSNCNASQPPQAAVKPR